MVLQALQFVEWGQMRVLIGEIDDDAERDLVVFLVVKERTHAGAEHPAKRPADVMQDAAWYMPLGIHVPQFLQTDTVVLRSP